MLVGAAVTCPEEGGSPIVGIATTHTQTFVSHPANVTLRSKSPSLVGAVVASPKLDGPAVTTLYIQTFVSYPTNVALRSESPSLVGAAIASPKLDQRAVVCTTSLYI
jgi:hypothetical protein